MFQIDVLSDTRPREFNAVGEFIVGGGADVTTDDIYQVVGNMSTIRGKHALQLAPITRGDTSSPIQPTR